MINLKTQDGETILTIDEKEEQPIRQLVKRQKAIINLNIMLICISLLLSGFLVWTNYFCKQTGLTVLVETKYSPETIPDYDPIAVPIPSDEKPEGPVEKIDINKMLINMASTVELKDTYASGHFNIINSEANNYPQFVTITIDNNNTPIFQTGLIEPGKCVPYDTLNIVLPKGTYECTETFVQVDPANKKACGKAAAKVTITVLS